MSCTGKKNLVQPLTPMSTGKKIQVLIPAQSSLATLMPELLPKKLQA
jgi:hypothetical protein